MLPRTWGYQKELCLSEEIRGEKRIEVPESSCWCGLTSDWWRSASVLLGNKEMVSRQANLLKHQKELDHHAATGWLDFGVKKFTILTFEFDVLDCWLMRRDLQGHWNWHPGLYLWSKKSQEEGKELLWSSWPARTREDFLFWDRAALRRG